MDDRYLPNAETDDSSPWGLVLWAGVLVGLIWLIANVF